MVKKITSVQGRRSIGLRAFTQRKIMREVKRKEGRPPILKKPEGFQIPPTIVDVVKCMRQALKTSYIGDWFEDGQAYLLNDVFYIIYNRAGGGVVQG